MVWYLDTSAFLKLIVTEDESFALRAWVGSHGPLWSSELLRTEALRAGSRLGLPASVVEDALQVVSTVLPSVATFRTAGHMAPPPLRSLDAVHLATALELGGDLAAVIAYDVRLIEAARAVALEVVTPV